MKIDKIVQAKKEIELNVIGATLLSEEEYEEYKKNIPWLWNDWWLRSTGHTYELDSYARYVDGEYKDGEDENKNVYSLNVDIRLGVRPALIISDSCDLIIGDKLSLCGYDFTVISDKYALCNHTLIKAPFRADWRAADAEDYEHSDVKKCVDSWFKNIR